MTYKDKGDKLVRIHLFICKKFEELKFHCERFSNNNQPEFTDVVEILLTDYQLEDCCLNQSLLGSMPIIICSGKGAGKVATEITDKGYCPTKGIHYYGLKSYLLGYRRKGKLPHPRQVLFTPALVNDLFSTTVSRIRQPIEALFNWLIEKAGIQKASKVRSTKGLIVHAFGRLAAAYITLAI